MGAWVGGGATGAAGAGEAGAGLGGAGIGGAGIGGKPKGDLVDGDGVIGAGEFRCGWRPLEMRRIWRPRNERRDGWRFRDRRRRLRGWPSRRWPRNRPGRRRLFNWTGRRHECRSRLLDQPERRQSRQKGAEREDRRTPAPPQATEQHAQQRTKLAPVRTLPMRLDPASAGEHVSSRHLSGLARDEQFSVAIVPARSGKRNRDGSRTC